MSHNGLPPMHLIILAGGLGARAHRGDSTPPKQFRRIGGMMLLMRSVSELAAVPEVTSLIVAAPEPWHPLVANELEAAPPGCPWHLAEAGATRTGSTWQAVVKLGEEHLPQATDLVAVHDAARPFATHHLLLRLAEAAAKHGGAVPGVPVADTIVQMQEGEHGRAEAGYLAREGLRALQTPQVFRWEPFRAAHHWCHEQDLSFTDDGGLLAAQGVVPVIVMGEPENWKVTTDGDLARAEVVFRDNQ